MKMDGLILAGGKSTRMGGKHKGDLLYRDVAFTERIVRQFRKNEGQIWLSYGKEAGKTYEGCTVITDIYPDCGPVGGIYTGLVMCESDAVMAAACDMPLMKIELFRHLEEVLAREERRGADYAAVVPVVDGRVHPLAAIYKVEMRDVLKAQILEGNYRIRDALRKREVLYVDLSDEAQYRDMLRNVNTEEEYKELLENKESCRGGFRGER